jgi:hypothetical protein
VNNFPVRCALWLVTLLLYPVPSSLIVHSFRVEVLGQHSLQYGALPQEPKLRFSDRVVVRLAEAEWKEIDAWYRDDYRIARVTVGFARSGSPIPHVEACYRVLGVHPDQVWPRIVARRQAFFGAEYETFFGKASSPKKPVRSVGLEECKQRNKAA